MQISPIGFNSSITGKSCVAREFVPATVRYNSLSDMDFNIIADKIRCQNMKNQMNVRLMNLKRSINSCMAQNFYK